jgi:DNA processing protein
LDVVYPGRHLKLAHAIQHSGAVVSEFAFEALPEAGNFPRRNRIISGLCVATVVVEARKTGGALITARIALDQNREVFAVPGPVTSPQSSGCNALIQRGEAMLVTSALEIAEALGLAEVGASDDLNPASLTPAERQLWDVITDEPKHVDQLCVESGVDIGGLLATLLRLECGGAVHQLAGSRYVRSRSHETRTRQIQ